jgi:hypothetical protein
MTGNILLFTCVYLSIIALALGSKGMEIERWVFCCHLNPILSVKSFLDVQPLKPCHLIVGQACVAASLLQI